MTAYKFRAVPPLSIRIGNKWISYSRIEPLAVTLATIVDAINEIKNAEAGMA